MGNTVYFVQNKTVFKDSIGGNGTVGGFCSLPLGKSLMICA